MMLLSAWKEEQMKFGEAIEAVKNGELIARAGWNGKGMWLVYQERRIDDLGRVILPHLLMKTVQGEYVPWLASQTDVLAEDWEVTP
jgi:hypothetical protein